MDRKTFLKRCFRTSDFSVGLDLSDRCWSISLSISSQISQASLASSALIQASFCFFVFFLFSFVDTFLVPNFSSALGFFLQRLMHKNRRLGRNFRSSNPAKVQVADDHRLRSMEEAFLNPLDILYNKHEKQQRLQTNQDVNLIDLIRQRCVKPHHPFSGQLSLFSCCIVETVIS